MLKKKNRATTKAVKEIFKRGLFLNSPNLTFRFIKTTQTTPPQISFIVPKSTTKSAVKRNLLRRHGYVVLEKKIKEVPLGLVGIFLFKKPDVSILMLEKEIKAIIDKI